ncbi:MAG: hypothetical protein RL150_257 [Candidatus Parcubacteria bacterium]|jgi:hypothetical protein
MPEDIYDLEGEASSFGDYINAWYLPISNLMSRRKQWDEATLFNWIEAHPIQSFTLRYGGGKSSSMEWCFTKYPTRVARLDRLSELANSCKDITEFKRICNELFRLVNGRVAFPGELYNPDLLEL